MGSLTNEFIKNRANQLGLKQVAIVKEIAKRKNREPDLYKGIVNKWFKTDQEPGKEYLLELSEILNVSIESILRGYYIPSNDTRATAYSAALTGDIHLIDRLFGSLESYDVRVTTTDEYGKSFIDYVIEFDNYQALKNAITRGYCDITHNNIFTYLTVNSSEKALSLLKMIIKADDIDIFEKVFSRITPVSEEKVNNASLSCYQFPYELCDDVLQSKKILQYFITPLPLSKYEKEMINGYFYQTNSNPLDNIPSLTPCFNTLLNKALNSDDKEKKDMLTDIAISYFDSISSICKPFYDELQIENDGALRFKGSRPILAYVPIIKNNDNPTIQQIYTLIKNIKENKELNNENN